MVPVVALAAASAVRASYAAMRADVSSELLPERGGGAGVAAGEGKDLISFPGRGGGASEVEEKGFFGGNLEGTCSFFSFELGLEEEKKGGGEDARESWLSLGLEERSCFRMGEVLRSSSSEDQEADMGSLSGELRGGEEAIDAAASSPTVTWLLA